MKDSAQRTELHLDESTTEKLDRLIDLLQMVLELIHVKNNTDLNRIRRQIKRELLAEINKEL